MKFKFCSTRKNTQQAAQILSKNNNYIRDQRHKQALLECSPQIKDPKLRELVADNGIAYHHAGLDTHDRRIIESLFLNGDLLVLC